MPIVSCQDPEDIVSRFGHYTGRFDGTGMDAIPHFREGLASLLEDSERRMSLGAAGQAWAFGHHGRENFLTRFAAMCNRLGGAHLYSQRRDLRHARIEPTGSAKASVLAHEDVREISTAVPRGKRFVLIDNDELRSLFGPPAAPIPFLERNGEYWGPPANDDAAIQELEQLRRNNVNHVVVASTAFWWLEHYTGFLAFLESQQIAATKTDSYMLFTLAQKECVEKNEVVCL